MKSTIFKSVVFIATWAVLFSCNESMNAPDENLLAKDQESQSTKKVPLVVIIKDNFEGKFFYKVEIFDSNPENSSATLLKSGLGTKDLSFSTTVAVPEFHKTIFVRQNDTQKNQINKSFDVTVINNAIT